MSENSQHHEGNSRKRTRTVCDMDSEDVGRFFEDCEDDVDDYDDDDKFVQDTDKIIYVGKGATHGVIFILYCFKHAYSIYAFAFYTPHHFSL